MTTTRPLSLQDWSDQLPDGPYEDDPCDWLDGDLTLDDFWSPTPPKKRKAARRSTKPRTSKSRTTTRTPATKGDAGDLDQTRWPALDRSPRPEHQDLFDKALELARTIDLSPATPAGLPDLTGLPGERRAKEGRGGATSVVTTMRMIIRSPYPTVLGALWPDRTGLPGRPATPAAYWFFLLALTRELRSLEQAHQEVTAHWDDVIVPEFAAQGIELRPVGKVRNQGKIPGWNGLRRWRDKLIADGLLGPVNMLFTVLSIRLHVSLAEALGHRDGGLLNPGWWQVPFADSTVMRAPSEVFYYCPLCGPGAPDCQHPVDLIKGHNSRAKTDGRERVAAQGRDYGGDKSHGNKAGMHNIAIGASNGKLYRRTVLAVDVDAEARGEMDVAMPLLAHFFDLAGPSWIRGLAYDGLLKGSHQLDLMRRYGHPAISIPATANSDEADPDRTDIPGSTVRRSGKHKGVRVATWATQQRIVEHRDDFGQPCFHFIICDDGATYDSPFPLELMRAQKLRRGTLLTPVDMARRQQDDGTWEVLLSFEIQCRSHTERFDVDLTASRTNSKGDVPYSEPIQAHRHFCDADPERLSTIIGVRSNIESLFGWLEQRFMHKDRVASWEHGAQLLDLLSAGVAANAEVWAHAQADFAAAQQ